MKLGIGIGLLLAGLTCTSLGYANESDVPVPLVEFNSCDRINSTKMECVTFSRGNPSSHPQYIFDDSNHTIDEQFPIPTTDFSEDIEYLVHIIYQSNRFGGLGSVSLVTYKRIGDQFVTREDLSNGSYNEVDSRDGRIISTCAPDWCIDKGRIIESKRIIRVGENGFEKYLTRFKQINSIADILK